MGGKSSKSSKSTTKEVAKKVVVTPFKVGDAVKSIYVSFSEELAIFSDMFYSFFLLLFHFHDPPPHLIN
jgi:hypothetical protein